MFADFDESAFQDIPSVDTSTIDIPAGEGYGGDWSDGGQNFDLGALMQLMMAAQQPQGDYVDDEVAALPSDQVGAVSNRDALEALRAEGIGGGVEGDGRTIVPYRSGFSEESTQVQQPQESQGGLSLMNTLMKGLENAWAKNPMGVLGLIGGGLAGFMNPPKANTLPEATFKKQMKQVYAHPTNYNLGGLRSTRPMV